jgi:hypothetical protein
MAFKDDLLKHLKDPETRTAILDLVADGIRDSKVRAKILDLVSRDVRVGVLGQLIKEHLRRQELPPQELPPQEEFSPERARKTP